MKKNFDPSSKSYVPSTQNNNNQNNTSNNKKPVVVVRRKDNNNSNNYNESNNNTKTEISIKPNKNNHNNYNNNNREPKIEQHSRNNNNNKNKQTSKKNQVSGNHLLQFNYKREELEQHNNNKNNYRNQKKHIPVFNKKRYVEANYSFVLKNMDRFFLDTNHKNNFVDWENVEQVILFSCEKIKCPICLEKPIVPKITKCGHIYCWTCILRYITEFEAKRGCPVCSDNSTFWNGEKELKSIEIIKSNKIIEGDKIKMRLLAREINSNVVLPFDKFKRMGSLERTIILSCDDENSKYNRYTFANTTFLKKMLKREYEGLEKLLEEAKINQETSFLFIEQAMAQLNDRRELNAFPQFSDKQYLTPQELNPIITNNNNNNDNDNDISIDHNNDNDNNSNTSSSSFTEQICPFPLNSPPKIEESIIPIIEKSSEKLNIESWDSVDNNPPLHSNERDQPKTVQIQHSENQVEKNTNSQYEFKTVQTTSQSPSKNSSKIKKNQVVEINIENGIDFFYQSEDGSSVFIDPFNDKCIQSQFQSFSKAPLFIEGKILEIFAEEQNNEKHIKHLNHVPLSAHFKFVELDLFQNKTLNYQTKSQFFDEFKYRDNKRKKKKQMIINEKKKEEINILELQRKNEMEIEELCKKFPSFKEALEEEDTYSDFPIPHEDNVSNKVDFSNREDKRTPFFDDNDFQYSSYAFIASKKNTTTNNNNNNISSKSPPKQKNIQSVSPQKNTKTSIPLSSSPIEELSNLSFDLVGAIEKAKSNNKKSNKKKNKKTINLSNGPNYKI